MAQFTQLNLSGVPDKKPEGNREGKTSQNNARNDQRPQTKGTKLDGKQKVAALAGSLIASSLLTIFLLQTGGCSKGTEHSNQAVMNQNSNQQAMLAPSTPALPSTTATTAVPTPAQKPAQKKSRQRKLSASTYTNPAYGISFRYPKYDSLKDGDKANLQWDGLGPVEMNFVQPGGTTVSAVELPHTLYAGTDFATAFFNVNVNSKMTAEQCQQFAFPDAGVSENDSAASSKVKVGATEFNQMEGIGGKDTRQADAKYYHVFENGMCYEFVLGLETAADDTADNTMLDLRPVNRNEVFRRLNWILSTVKIEPAILPAKTTPEEAVPEKVVSEKVAAEKAVPEVTPDVPPAPQNGSNEQ
jgi:hypothetical protein